MHIAEDTSDASFIVEPKRPQVYILSPDADISIPENTQLVLEGYAYDLEDGPGGGVTLNWASDRDGSLGTGNTILAKLSPGQHKVTLSATDTDGNFSTVSIRIFVVPNVYLPIILR